MQYMPLSPDDVREMLAAIGIGSIKDLFAQIPESVQLQHQMDLPPSMSEIELRRLVHGLADENYDGTKSICFAGGTCYYHYVPSAVDKLSSLPELLTAYTPYQPELSQGMLTAIFEWQTVITDLTGHPVANASLYDGSTAVCEAARMTVHHTDKKVVSISNLVHPSYIETLKSFAAYQGFEVKVIPNKGDRVDLEAVKAAAKESASVIIQSPNVTGTIEDVESVSKAVKENGGYLIQNITEAISLGLLKRPGEMGVDICVGDAQSFGNYLAFGGPHLGFVTCTEEFLRKLPGRIVGETTDRNGKTCLTMTLRPREQDIKREKATSNICTNNSNSMLRGLIYVLLMGKKGLREVAVQCYDKAHYLSKKAEEEGIKTANQNPFFNEVTLILPKKPETFLVDMLAKGFVVSPTTTPLDNSQIMITVAVTEMITKDEIDAFVSTLAEVAR